MMDLLRLGGFIKWGRTRYEILVLEMGRWREA